MKLESFQAIKWWIMWKEKNSFISNLLQISFSKQIGDRSFKSILFREIAPWKYFLKDLFKSRVPCPAALQIPLELLKGLKYNTIPSTCSLVFKLFQGYLQREKCFRNCCFSQTRRLSQYFIDIVNFYIYMILCRLLETLESLESLVLTTCSKLARLCGMGFWINHILGRLYFVSLNAFHPSTLFFSSSNCIMYDCVIF